MGISALVPTKNRAKATADDGRRRCAVPAQGHDRDIDSPQPSSSREIDRMSKPISLVSAEPSRS
jgi:hypothetical protein